MCRMSICVCCSLATSLSVTSLAVRGGEKGKGVTRIVTINVLDKYLHMYCFVSIELPVKGCQSDSKDFTNLKQKMDDDLLKMNESEEVDSRINLMRDTRKEQLQMKWLDFLALKIDNYADYQGPAPTKTIAPRSRSLSRKPQRLGNLQRTWTRVQSVDREKMDEEPTFSCLRSPRVPCEVASPLGVPKHSLEKRCANRQTPTSQETAIVMKPKNMMNRMKREALKNWNQNTQA